MHACGGGRQIDKYYAIIHERNFWIVKIFVYYEYEYIVDYHAANDKIQIKILFLPMKGGGGGRQKLCRRAAIMKGSTFLWFFLPSKYATAIQNIDSDF